MTVPLVIITFLDKLQEKGVNLPAPTTAESQDAIEGLSDRSPNNFEIVSATDNELFFKHKLTKTTYILTKDKDTHFGNVVSLWYRSSSYSRQLVANTLQVGSEPRADLYNTACASLFN